MSDAPEEIQSILRRFEAKDTNDQLHILATRMGEIASAVAVHGERDDAMADRLDKLEAKFDKMSDKVDNLDDMANKWRGGFALLLGAGALSGAILAFWDKFARWVHP